MYKSHKFKLEINNFPNFVHTKSSIIIRIILYLLKMKNHFQSFSITCRTKGCGAGCSRGFGLKMGPAVRIRSAATCWWFELPSLLELLLLRLRTFPRPRPIFGNYQHVRSIQVRGIKMFWWQSASKSGYIAITGFLKSSIIRTCDEDDCIFTEVMGVWNFESTATGDNGVLPTTEWLLLGDVVRVVGGRKMCSYRFEFGVCSGESIRASATRSLDSWGAPSTALLLTKERVKDRKRWAWIL